MGKLVSVIIPTHNREKMIANAIDSVLKQSYKNIEVVIVDDCSEDHTELLIREKYGDLPNVKYYKLPRNFGACAARNKGVGFSKGEYIAFLDSDDVFYPFKIKSQVDELEKTNSDICVSSHHFKYEDKERNVVIGCHSTSPSFYDDLLYGNFITTGTLLGKRKCFEETLFDEQLSYWEDWDLILRLAAKYAICFVEEPTLMRERHNDSLTVVLTHRDRLSALQKIYAKHQKGYRNNNRADVRMKWVMGLHSTFLNKEERQYSNLWHGVVGDGFSLKRFAIFLCAIFRIKFIVELAC